MTAAVLLAVSVAQAGWAETSRDDECVFYKGAQEGAVVPVRAVCDWPIPADRLQGMLAESGEHERYFDSLRESTVRGRAGDKELVYQIHQAVGASDREVVVEMWSEPIDGGRRFFWQKAPDQSGLSGEHVEIELDSGSWSVTGDESSCRLVYELRYAAGGYVPAFLVRWFQGAGVRMVLSELRAHAEL